MRILRWTFGQTKKNKIQNDHIQEQVGVTPITENLVENRLSCFGHVQRRPIDVPVRRVGQTN